MKSGGEFSHDGRRYVVRAQNFVRRADTVLWNDGMVLHLSHLGEVDGAFLTPELSAYALTERLAYVRDETTGEFWTAPFSPSETAPEQFECSFGRADVSWRLVNHGLEVTMRVFVPWRDNVELWTITARNLCNRPRRVSVFTCFPIGVRSWFSSHGAFDRRLGGLIYEFFPYYAKVQDYYERLKMNRMVFCVPDRPPTAYEINLDEFKGTGGFYNPAGLRQTRLSSCPRVERDPAAAVYQYLLTLKPAQVWRVNLLFGPAPGGRAQVAALKRRYLAAGAVERAYAEVYRFREQEVAPLVRIETPDTELNHFVNHWLPEETLRIARTLRHSSCASERNAFLDAAGGLYVDPSLVRRWYPVIFRVQHEDGFMPHGVPLFPGVVPGGINAIPHRDVSVWPPPQLHFYISETGDWDVLDLQIPWKTTEKTSSLYEHVDRGIVWQLRNRSKRGLSLIGEGDWNDPLNMAGWQGRGESVWLTEALVWALDQWAEIVERRGDRRKAAMYRREAELTRRRINRLAWDGAWYARGTTDAGKWFGVRANDEGRIYLNPQAWAMICGAATGTRVETCIRAVRRHLATPWGNVMLAPPYTRMHEDIGKLCLKRPGLEENGSVYCHAQLFYAQGLYTVGRADEAFEAVRVVLPGYKGNTVQRSGQIPIYVPNYFRGLAAGRSAGRSSHEAVTGSAPWCYRSVVAWMLGVQGSFDGLRLAPQLPSHWPGARVWRKYRDAEFDIEIRQLNDLQHLRVFLDGHEISGNVIPPQPPGSRHTVLVLTPRRRTKRK